MNANRLATLLGITVFIAVPALVMAEKPASSNDDGIPEANGDYPDPQHPGVHVRVFVHEPKEPGKKAPSTGSASACDNPDSTAITGATGWKLPSGNWTYTLNPSSVPSSVGSSSITTIASAGFTAWDNALGSAASKPNLVPSSSTTNKTRSSYDNLNIIAWGRTSGSTLGVTYVRYYTSTGLVVDVDTIMNSRVPWSWNSCTSNAYDAQDILTHEQGHWYGLDDEYTADYVDNTMYGYGSKNEVKKDTPATGDSTGIHAIYPL